MVPWCGCNSGGIIQVAAVYVPLAIEPGGSTVAWDRQAANRELCLGEMCLAWPVYFQGHGLPELTDLSLASRGPPSSKKSSLSDALHLGPALPGLHGLKDGHAHGGGDTPACPYTRFTCAHTHTRTQACGTLDRPSHLYALE